ncbi:NADP-dependent oxidoreductase domain-containing protein [Aspergillus keveii]|uniref:NADP-dependent oxidoreductase domain-containing protein n=1 Tax=Aspergillus keveii TaxID=714993 RepID=A0ABR4FH73_9EURO
MSSTKVELIFGGSGFSTDVAPLGTFDDMKEALCILKNEGVCIIDTASTYGDSEKVLGELGAVKTHTIHSKYPGGFSPALSTKDSIITAAKEGLKKSKAEQFEVYYLHSPDRRVPWEPQLSAMTTLHQEGKIKCFGLSNFLAAEVEDIIRIAKENNFVLPTVYQGSYNAIGRRPETEILPTLRKHGIKFYAYSPIAGGFLAKDPDQLRYPRGRWDPSTFVGGLYHLLYNKPQMLEGLKLWGNIAEGYGVSKVELAYRWIVYHSALKGEFGDKIIFGSKNLRQLKDTLHVIKNGPLDPNVVEQIEEVWELVENEAPLDNYNLG